VKLLDQMHHFLESRAELATDKAGHSADLEMRAATAVLLLEAAYGDTEYLWREHRTILKALERDFGLGKQETLELLGRADEIRPPVVALADVTAVIRDRYTKEQRKEVVRLVWRVVEADGVVEEWERAFADHIAEAVGLDAAEAREARAAS